MSEPLPRLESQNLRGPSRPRSSAAMTALLILASAYTLYLAADLLIPIAFSVLLSILFFPLVQYMARWGVPRALSSALIVTGVVVVIGLAVATLAEPAQDWLRKAPQSLRQLRYELLQARENLEDISNLAQEVKELTTVEKGGGREEPQPVVVQEPGVFEEFLGHLPLLTGTAIAVIFLTFFMLADGDSLVRKATRCGRTFAERRRFVTMARRLQSELSRYLATVTIINILLGCATGVTLFFLDVPNPALWGTMAGLFNFAPYVGALVSLMVLTVVGLTEFPNLGDAALVPGSFLILTTLEGQVITPTIIGRNMSIDPTLVLLSVVVWGWLWGVAGALMAVPLLACLRAISEHYPPLWGVAQFVHKLPLRTDNAR